VTVQGSIKVARAIQHETDHLDGVLFVDRLDPETRKQAMREIRQAQWFAQQGSTQPEPVVKVSPHPLLGRVR
jgi:N-formylmethionyl-tRNA deformylase